MNISRQPNCYLFMYGARKEDETTAVAAAATAHCVHVAAFVDAICLTVFCHSQNKANLNRKHVESCRQLLCVDINTHTNTPRPHTFTRRVSEYCAYAQFKFKKTHIHQRNY